MSEASKQPARRGFDLRTLDIERFIQRLGQSYGDAEPVADPYLSLHLQQTFDHTTQSRLGRIQASLPFMGWYRVAVEGMSGVIPCCRLSSDCSPSLYGVIDTVTLPPDCAVFVQVHRSNRYGFITGAVPYTEEDGNMCLSDWVVQGSHVGFRDPYHIEPVVQTSDNGGVIDFSNGRPLDNLTTDWDRVTTTGLGLHLDPFLAYMRVSEVCGVFGFYPDEMLRVAGRELQVLSAAHVQTFMDDEGELTTHYGETPYPWEMLGAYEFGSQMHRTVSDTDVHDKRTEGKFEPVVNDQKPLLRFEEYGGYLGQGHIRQMSVPRQPGSEVNAYSRDHKRLGVFREFVGLDGEYIVSTAKGLTLAKTTLIPIPERKRMPADQREDSDNAAAGNYKFGGVFGEGPEHKLSEVENPNQNSENLASVLGLLDHLAYATNWKTLVGFHYHTGDYETPQEGDVGPVGKSQTSPDFYQLKDSYAFDQPEAKEVQVDPRLLAKYYEVLQLFKFTDDGGVVIQGGFGEQIRFVRGEIYLDAPGHIHVRSGKSTVVLAGDDAVVRARNSLDLSASLKDVRVKAERNLLMLSGNGGTGGTLIESRSSGNEQNYPESGGEAVEASGIVLKSANSLISTMSAGLYLRTGNSQGGVSAGKIVLDAAKGDADIVSIASDHQRFSKGQCIDSFGFPRVSGVNQYGSSQTLLGSSMQVNGSVGVRGSLSVRSGVQTASGHFQSPSGGDVGRLRNPSLVDNQLAQIEQEVETAKGLQSVSYRNDIDAELRGDDRVGNDEVQKQISFGFRNENDCGTQNFTMPQAHWHLLAAGSGATIAWTEKSVKYRGETDTMPWPGKAKWADEDTLLSLPAAQHTMYDAVAGKAKDRPSPYENPTLGTITKQKPSAGYLVIDT